LPVLLQIASWSSSGSLGDWLAEELSGRYGMPLMTAKVLIDRGTLVSVLDGLDELVAAQQPRFIDMTRAFIELSRNKHGSARMVLTTRSAGGLDLAIRLRLRAAVELQPLDRAEASEYLQRHAPSKEESDRVRQFVEASPAFDLSSPLMIRLLLRIIEDEGTLPSSPAEAIDWFAHDQLEKLGKKGNFDPRAAENWLGALAKHLSSKQEGMFSSDDPEIRSVLREEGLRGREVPAFLRAAAEQGLLFEVRENQYGFTHLSLQEYFSAR